MLTVFRGNGSVARPENTLILSSLGIPRTSLLQHPVLLNSNRVLFSPLLVEPILNPPSVHLQGALLWRDTAHPRVVDITRLGYRVHGHL